MFLTEKAYSHGSLRTRELGQRKTKRKMAKNKHHYKWFITSLKTMSYIILAAVLIYEILNGVSKLNAKEMTYTSTTAVQQPIIYPTVTMCIMMDMTFHKPMSVNWVDPEKYNLSFPFENFGMVEDTFQNM
jgi:hypothetical protein